MTGEAPVLVLSGAAGAMALGATMVYFVRRRDFVALSLGLFLFCVSVSLMLGRGSAAGQWSAYLALPFLACFVAALHPGRWQRGAALAVAFLGGAAAALGALVLVQGLALAVAAWATAAAARLMRERRSAWPVLIAVMAFTYAGMLLDLVGANGLVPAGFLAFVLTPAVVLTRRAIRAFDAEERRARDQAKFTTDVFDSVPVALSMRDTQGKYLFVNRTWEKYYGHRRENVIGTSPRSRASEAEADKLLAMDKAALEAGPGAPLPPMDFALGDRRYLQTRTAMADSQGRLLGVLIASIDTTDRVAMEQALAAEQRRLALVVRAANAGILDWDGLTRTVYYSGRFKELLRYPPDSDTSAWPDFFELVHPEDLEQVNQRFRQHILAVGPEGAHELHQPIQYRLRRADGGYVWIEAVGASVRDARGYVTRFIASFTDISERRAQEEALRTSVRLREEVERMSRHDLKTPLNSVIAMSRLLRGSGKLGPQDDELLGSIERAGYRILNMVNLSLDLFRMEQGKYEFRPRPVDLATVARRVAADLEGQAASKRVAVRLRASGATAAYAEELLCYSMLANLIKNAIEAAPDDSAVGVAVEPRGEALLIHVHNAGAVPESVRSRFFQKYATAGKSAGLGLGTYSARLMARMQQGEITLRTSQDEGTTVTVQLGLARQPELPPEQPPLKKSVQEEISMPGQRVLIVDDDEFNRLVLRHCLPSPPFEVELAVNGRAALEAARNAWPDAVFLDLEMPVMDGYEAAAKLRQLEREGGRKRCIIVAISSNDEAAIIQRALQAGCDHYLVKPAPRETLLRILAGEAPAPPGGAAAPEAAQEDPVELDPDLEASLPAFYASRRKALDEMPANLAADDRVRFKRLAHKLAGSFTMYGFRWAAAQCRALERDAPGGAAGELARRAAAVRAHLDTVKVSLRVE
jgi:PAS domain S-box-containing protein